MNPKAWSGFLLVGAIAACSSGASVNETTVGESNADNKDVQMISARSQGAILWNVSKSARFDASKCTFQDRTAAPASHAEFTATAKAECTDALAQAMGVPPINRYIEPIAWIREDPNISNAAMRHWCSQVEVVVAVKASGWDSPSFEGIGFYGYESTLNQESSHRTVFYSKNDTRLVRVAERTLKNEGHQKVYLYKFSGAGPCETNGSGDDPSGKIEFKPFVRYAGGHERWEAVNGNHSLAFRQSFDRTSDLLN